MHQIATAALGTSGQKRAAGGDEIGSER